MEVGFGVLEDGVWRPEAGLGRGVGSAWRGILALVLRCAGLGERRRLAAGVTGGARVVDVDVSCFVAF